MHTVTDWPQSILVGWRIDKNLCWKEKYNAISFQDEKIVSTHVGFWMKGFEPIFTCIKCRLADHIIRPLSNSL